MVERKTSDERREQILETGLRILHEKGRSELTVGNIAEEIGVSEAAVYKHFDSKKEIVKGMAEKVFSVQLVEPEEVSFQSPEKLLEDIISGIFTKLEKDPKVTSILFHDELFTEYPEVEKVFKEHRREKKSKLKNLVRMGQASDLFSQNTDPDTFANMVMGSIRITVLEWREEDFSYSLEEKAELLASHLARIV